MIDEKDLELLFEKLKSYNNTACKMYEYYKDLGPEWERQADRNYGEAIGYGIAIITIRKALRGELS